MIKVMEFASPNFVFSLALIFALVINLFLKKLVCNLIVFTVYTYIRYKYKVD